MSSIFKPLRTVWTPVFTGVTTKRQFFHTFFVKGGPGPEPFRFRAGEISEIHCQYAHKFFSSRSIKKTEERSDKAIFSKNEIATPFGLAMTVKIYLSV